MDAWQRSKEEERVNRVSDRGGRGNNTTHEF